jgi:hypothetical protein
VINGCTHRFHSLSQDEFLKRTSRTHGLSYFLRHLKGQQLQSSKVGQ